MTLATLIEEAASTRTGQESESTRLSTATSRAGRRPEITYWRAPMPKNGRGFERQRKATLK